MGGLIEGNPGFPPFELPPHLPYLCIKGDFRGAVFRPFSCHKLLDNTPQGAISQGLPGNNDIRQADTFILSPGPWYIVSGSAKLPQDTGRWRVHQTPRRQDSRNADQQDARQRAKYPQLRVDFMLQFKNFRLQDKHRDL